jgi:hypothetical protein
VLTASTPFDGSAGRATSFRVVSRIEIQRLRSSRPLCRGVRVPLAPLVIAVREPHYVQNVVHSVAAVGLPPKLSLCARFRHFFEYKLRFGGA